MKLFYSIGGGLLVLAVLSLAATANGFSRANYLAQVSSRPLVPSYSSYGDFLGRMREVDISLFGQRSQVARPAASALNTRTINSISNNTASRSSSCILPLSVGCPGLGEAYCTCQAGRCSWDRMMGYCMTIPPPPPLIPVPPPVVPCESFNNSQASCLLFYPRCHWWGSRCHSEPSSGTGCNNVNCPSPRACQPVSVTVGGVVYNSSVCTTPSPRGCGGGNKRCPMG